MCARKIFYVFSRVDRTNEFCAVRQDQPIPGFLDGVSWELSRILNIPVEKLLGFDLDDAEAATRKSGVYHFRREFSFALSWNDLDAA
ncbi:hypothetical protein [Bradyrhizobium sp. P5_C11_2]